MDLLVQRWDEKLREGRPEVAETVRRHIVEILSLADPDMLELMRSRAVEQEVVDLLDEPTPR